MRKLWKHDGRGDCEEPDEATEAQAKKAGLDRWKGKSIARSGDSTCAGLRVT